MKTTISRGTTRRAGALSLAVALSLGMAACGNSSTSAATSGSDSMQASAAAQTFGPGCKLVPRSGAGSFNGMATDPVATAASNNPLLTTLVTAVKKAGLVDTLDSAKALTVFAPTDDAFKKIPSSALDKVLADKGRLTKLLEHHVVAGQLSPSQLAGTHKTLAGDTITVKGSGKDFTVDHARVLCGNIPTANATVYVVDSVLMP
ncbi:MAG TPA: fasciclin domain-containing protein [Marmoricola sp.]|nr:fasciclin domain-containing protein [Marmoricola sp.]